jgi:hypothetical protein
MFEVKDDKYWKNQMNVVGIAIVTNIVNDLYELSQDRMTIIEMRNKYEFMKMDIYRKINIYKER